MEEREARGAAREERAAGGVEVAVEGEEFLVEGAEGLVGLEGFADGDAVGGVVEGGEGTGGELAEEGSAEGGAFEFVGDFDWDAEDIGFELGDEAESGETAGGADGADGAGEGLEGIAEPCHGAGGAFHDGADHFWSAVAAFDAEEDPASGGVPERGAFA